MADSGGATYLGSRRESAREDAFDGARGLARLRAIEGAGISLSRNKNFGLFSNPHNLSALRARHYLDRLGRSMLRVAEDGRGSISIHQSGESIEVALVAPWLAARRSAFLTAEELVGLGEDPAVAQLLRSLGVSLAGDVPRIEQVEGTGPASRG